MATATPTPGEAEAVSNARKQAEEEQEKAEKLTEQQNEAAKDPDLVPLVTVGDVPETLITNAMASAEAGMFPARTEDGDLVDIARKINVGTRMKLVDVDGNVYEDRGGGLVEWDDDAPTHNAIPEGSEKKKQQAAKKQPVGATSGGTAKE